MTARGLPGDGRAKPTMSWPDAVLLDLGNTLIEEPSFAAAAADIESAALPSQFDRKLTERLGDAVRAQLDNLYRDGRCDQPGWAKVWLAALSSLGISSTPEKADSLAQAHLRAFVSLWRPLPGAEPLLAALRAASVPTALVSNVTGPPGVFHEGLHMLGWSSHFGSVVWSSELGRRKPDPAPFLEAIRSLAVSPTQRVVMIGDNEHADIQGALRLGLTAIRVVKGSNLESQAHHRSELSNLPSLLASGGWWPAV